MVFGILAVHLLRLAEVFKEILGSLKIIVRKFVEVLSVRLIILQYTVVILQVLTLNLVYLTDRLQGLDFFQGSFE